MTATKGRGTSWFLHTLHRTQNPSTGSEIDAFLADVKSRAATASAGDRGRLLFAMDATMSRQPTWDRALAIQAEMFRETARIGGLDVQLIYFRGFGECRASKWVSNPNALARLMTGIDCRGGNTQIGKVLAHVKRAGAGKKTNAAVLVGDAFEESVDEVCASAGEIGMMGTPMFMFLEGHDQAAERAFREIARLTGGAFCRLDSGSAGQLRDLLSAVAVYAAGGRRALEDYARSRAGKHRTAASADQVAPNAATAIFLIVGLTILWIIGKFSGAGRCQRQRCARLPAAGCCFSAAFWRCAAAWPLPLHFLPSALGCWERVCRWAISSASAEKPKVRNHGSRPACWQWNSIMTVVRWTGKCWRRVPGQTIVRAQQGIAAAPAPNSR